MKSYTDLEQSKKLAEFLPLESADYHYIAQGEESFFYSYFLSNDTVKQYNGDIKYIPCWSLAALLGVLPMMKEGKENANPFIAKASNNEYFVDYATLTEEVNSPTIYDNSVDACVGMILKLHEQKFL